MTTAANSEKYVAFDTSLIAVEGASGHRIPVSYAIIPPERNTFNFEGDVQKLEKEICFQKPQWEKMIHGFAKMIPQMFSQHLCPTAVHIDANCSLVTLGDTTYEVPPYNKNTGATLFVDFHYSAQNASQLKNLREILTQSMKSPLLYSRIWACVDIYDHEEPRARIAMKIFAPSDAQLALFNDWASVDVLVDEFKEKVSSHLAGVAMLQKKIEQAG